MRNRQIFRLLQGMKKLCVDVNDVEICRRLEILLENEKEDLPKRSVDLVFQEGLAFDPKTLPEPYTQYVRHYIYMLKRIASGAVVGKKAPAAAAIEAEAQLNEAGRKKAPAKKSKSSASRATPKKAAAKKNPARR